MAMRTSWTLSFGHYSDHAILFFVVPESGLRVEGNRLRVEKRVFRIPFGVAHFHCEHGIKRSGVRIEVQRDSFVSIGVVPPKAGAVIQDTGGLRKVR
jgi:hypothetical protein